MIYPMQGEKMQLQTLYQRRQRNPRAKRMRNIKARRIVRHHMTNRCKGGPDTDSNLLHMKVEREKTLHEVFGNKSWEEIGDTLFQIFNLRDPQKCYEVIQRISRLKGRAA